MATVLAVSTRDHATGVIATYPQNAPLTLSSAQKSAVSGNTADAVVQIVGPTGLGGQDAVWLTSTELTAAQSALTTALS